MEEEKLLGHMLFYAKEAISLYEQNGLSKLKKSRELRESLYNFANKVDLAAGQISEQTKSHYSQIQWDRVIGGTEWSDHGYYIEVLCNYVATELKAVVYTLGARAK